MKSLVIGLLSSALDEYNQGGMVTVKYIGDSPEFGDVYRIKGFSLDFTMPELFEANKEGKYQVNFS